MLPADDDTDDCDEQSAHEVTDEIDDDDEAEHEVEHDDAHDYDYDMICVERNDDAEVHAIDDDEEGDEFDCDVDSDTTGMMVMLPQTFDEYDYHEYVVI